MKRHKEFEFNESVNFCKKTSKVQAARMQPNPQMFNATEASEGDYHLRLIDVPIGLQRAQTMCLTFS